jgi:hypothetical protein
VLDPCFTGTAVEDAALRLGCPVEFHPGFRVRLSGTCQRSPACRGTQ